MTPSIARIELEQVAALLAAGDTVDEVMCRSLPWAVAFSDAPVSGFAVGAIAAGASGALYAGANLEFAGLPLAASVHAEQSAVVNAWMHGERAIRAIAASAAPCGHCRQFLVELGDPRNLTVLVPQQPPATLAELLPQAFGPHDLGVAADGLLAAHDAPIDAHIDANDELARAALAAAHASYAPYTRAYAGIALRLAGGKIVTGRYAESAAYNPSLPALQAALAQLALAHTDRSTIVEAVLIEATAASSQRSAAEALLSSFSGSRLRGGRSERDSFR